MSAKSLGGRVYFVPEGSTIVARHEVPGLLQFGHFGELRRRPPPRELSFLGVERGSRGPCPEGAIGLSPGFQPWEPYLPCEEP
jgi:hypothetical protein